MNEPNLILWCYEKVSNPEKSIIAVDWSLIRDCNFQICQFSKVFILLDATSQETPIYRLTLVQSSSKPYPRKSRNWIQQRSTLLLEDLREERFCNIKIYHSLNSDFGT